MDISNSWKQQSIMDTPTTLEIYGGLDTISMGPNYLKQYGMKRSGTCYTKAFIEQNFIGVCVVANILGWKHGPHYIDKNYDGQSWLGDHRKRNRSIIDGENEKVIRRICAAYDTGNIGYVVTVRNPYLWLMSYAWYASVRLSAKAIQAYMHSWNKAHWGWLYSLPAQRTCFVRYEWLLESPDIVKKNIAVHLKHLAAKKDLVIPRKVVSPGIDYGQDYQERDRKKIMKRWNRKWLAAANRVLDPALMAFFQYEVVKK